jgi:hypothetical protein
VASNIFREALLGACLDIAPFAVTDVPHELHERFKLAEKQCFFEIVVD